MAGLFSSLQLPQSGIFGEPTPQNPLFDPRIAMASQLLAGTHSNEGFNTVFARALMAGQQARQQTAQWAAQQKEAQSQEALRQAQIDSLNRKEVQGPHIGALQPENYTPESIAKFQQTGNYGDLVPVSKPNDRHGSPFGNVNPGEFDPVSIAEYAKTVDPNTGIGDFSKLKRIWAPPAVSVQTTPGLGTVVVDPGNRLGNGPVQQITTPEQERAAAAQAAREREAAAAAGQATGAQDAKAPAMQSFEYVKSEFEKQLSKTTQGGTLGVKGKAGYVTNYDNAKSFDNLREQLSTEIRTVFRIPGEGTLSDREQQQYGLQLPDRSNSKEVNKKILDDLGKRVELRLKTQIGAGVSGSWGAPAPTGNRIRVDANGNVIK